MSMQQLAGWVRERRAELGLSQEAAAALGPLSDKTFRTVESGRATGVRRPTRLALERALRWESGSVEAAIDEGRKPRPLAGSPGSTPVDRDERVADAPAGRSTVNPGADGPASAGASFAVARAVLNLRRHVEVLRKTLGPEELETVLTQLGESQREAEIALGQAMQWIVNDDAKRREAAQLLYELQQPM